MFEQARGDPQKTALAEARYQRLINEPLDTMFQKLKEKLETLPTREQRRAAALAEKKESKERKSTPTDAAGQRRRQ
jgi:hypothetical protein